MYKAGKSTSRSKGALHIDLLFRSEEIGVSVPEPHTMRAIKIFLDVASGVGYQAIAPRLTQMPKGVLLFQMVANEPASGAIYILERESGNFYAVSFEEGREELTILEFEALVREYGLLEYAVSPHLIQGLVSTVHNA